MDVEEVFKAAMAHHRDGRLDEAAALYREILRHDTDHAPALYFLGRVAKERGEAAEAAALMAASLRIDPDQPTRANNLGTVFQGLGDDENAIKWFEAAIDANPRQAEAHLNLATIRHTQGRTEEAEAGYRRAIEADPDLAAAHANLSVLLRLARRYDEAAIVAARAVELDPGSASAHNNLGVIRHEQNRLGDAFKSLSRAVDLAPDYAEAYNNLGSVFRDENRIDGAVAAYRKAIELNPRLADAHNNLGSIRQRQGDYPAAQAHFETALELVPDFPPALANMGTICHRRNRQAEAVGYFRRALAIDPEFADAHFNLSEVLLLGGGDLREGWQEHRWRWRKREFRWQWRDFGVPQWRGEDPAGKRIAVWGEQGIGEEIMYAGMVPDLMAAGAEVVLECKTRLVPLFERSFPGAHCIDRGSEPPRYDGRLDFHTAAGDMGRWYRPDAKTFPARPRYLRADADRRESLRRDYKGIAGGPVVGLSWYSGNPEIGWEKSIELADWLPLLRVPGVTFIDLQYGDTRARREALKAETGIEIIHDDNVDQMVDLDAFAAQVAAMDLVISISNTTVHMAGALGVPCWVLLSEVPLWRWFQDREDSPWYPSLRLFRQRRAGKWDDIVAEAAARLAEWVKTQAPAENG